MARRKRGGSGPRSRGTNPKRAGSGKGPKRSFGKGVSAGVLGSIGAAVIGKLFNRDEKEVEGIIKEGGGRFGRDQMESLMNGGTGKGMTHDVTRHPEGPNAHGGEPEYQEGERPWLHDQLDTHPGDTDPLLRDIDEKIGALQQKVADAKRDAAKRRDTPEQRAGEQSGPPLGAEEVPEPKGAHQFEGTPPLGAGQGVLAPPPLSTTIAERAGEPAAPEFSAPPRMGPGQGVRKPGGAPLGALAAPQTPQTEPTAEERFASVFGGHRDRMEESRGALFGGNGGGETVPMPQNYREETIAKLSEEERQDFEGLSPEEQQAQLNEMWKQEVSGTAGAAESPTDFFSVPGRAAAAGAVGAVGVAGGIYKIAKNILRSRAAKDAADPSRTARSAVGLGLGRKRKGKGGLSPKRAATHQATMPGTGVPH